MSTFLMDSVISEWARGSHQEKLTNLAGRFHFHGPSKIRTLMSKKKSHEWHLPLRLERWPAFLLPLWWHDNVSWRTVCTLTGAHAHTPHRCTCTGVHTHTRAHTKHTRIHNAHTHTYTLCAYIHAVHRHTHDVLWIWIHWLRILHLTLWCDTARTMLHLVASHIRR